MVVLEAEYMSMLERSAQPGVVPLRARLAPGSRRGSVPLGLYPKDVYNAYSHSRLTFTVI